MISEYLEGLRREGRLSKTTVDISEGWLKRFQTWCAGRDPAALKSKDLQDWRQSLTWTPGPSGKLYSENTVSQAVLAVRAFYRWALWQGRLKVDPADGLKVRQVPKTEKTRLSGSEMRKLLASPNLDTPLGIRDRAVLGLVFEVSLSGSAISQLKLSNVALDTGALKAGGRRGGVYSLGDGLCADLERYLKEARPLLAQTNSPDNFFLNRKGQQLSTGSVSSLVQHARRRAGLRP